MRICIFLYEPDQSKLEEMVGELAQGLAVVKHEQEYMEVRERIHRMSEATVVMLYSTYMYEVTICLPVIMYVW